ncbi:hypothetical protein EIK77_008181 [Talaromyces pinophilus]|nr:hypothetical protein EIK77_008181 [Talaromyces pinophilus]
MHRHGARIDAVDKEWHLTSPTPYDPPLTYGGWIQGRALGARIASLLKAREDSVHGETIPTTTSSTSVAGNSTSETTPSEDFHAKPPKKVRKHKVIIHSSPFLRCVQTSIAISAGMSQFYRAENEHSNDHSPVSSTPASEEISPMGTPLRSSTPTSSDQWNRHKKDKLNHGKSTKVAPRTRLRIDAFLGEWLSPDYFDQITPPPGSVMMVAGAKAELLRRGEILHRANNHGSNSFSGNFPGGWKSNQTASSETPTENTSFGMSSLADSLPSEGQLGTEDGHRLSRPVKTITIRDVLSRSPSHSREDLSAGYIPPVPSYAISPSDPIPTGYVSHARDACVDVDYQWDSMKDPQNWGDGGEYDEEWSAMHRRFRNGLIKMVEWYSHEKPHKSHRHHHHHHHHHHHNHHSHNHDDDDDDETDTVLVLVTHGAGCNALIGALTNQPVLIDVAMASLTMAVRKDIFKAKTLNYQSADIMNNGHSKNHPSPSSLPLYHIYDLSLTASTEHLRVTSNPLSIPQLPSPTLERPRSISIYRHRTGSSPLRFPVNTIDNKTARSHGLQRSASINSAHHHYPSRSVSGLWASKEKENSIDESPGYQFEQRSTETNDSKMQKVADTKSLLPSFQEQKQHAEERIAEQPKSQLGLWGSATIAQAREPALKRRWTVTEQRG